MLRRNLFSKFLIVFPLLLLVAAAIAWLRYRSFSQKARVEFFTGSIYTSPAGMDPFKPNFDFPATLPQNNDRPWEAFDFKTESENYLRAVLSYVLEGNVEVNWDVGQNPKRTWYHAPWMHRTKNGNEREPIHGLTLERYSRAHELSPRQIRKTNNWAIGFYNAAGGYTLGQVWKNPAKPDSSKAVFPAGTVAAKILFSDATELEAPYLKANEKLTWLVQSTRGDAPVPMHLLQLDIAVRDERADDTTGWVFGTFVFDGSQNGSHYWKNLVPLGLQWGNDPRYTQREFLAGKPLKEGWLYPPAMELFNTRPPFGGMGYLGRMNGPVDNPFSSCLACHARASDMEGFPLLPANPSYESMAIREIPIGDNTTFELQLDQEIDETAIRHYFRNIKAGERFVSYAPSLDYSLQLAHGMNNYNQWVKKNYPDIYLLNYFSH